MQDKKLFLSQLQELNSKTITIWQKDFGHLRLVVVEGTVKDWLLLSALDWSLGSSMRNRVIWRCQVQDGKPGFLQTFLTHYITLQYGEETSS